MVEGTGFENRHRGNLIESSNLSLSAINMTNMERQTITKQAVKEVLSQYWFNYKEKPLHTIITFLLPAIGTVLLFFVPPLVMAKIINIFVEQGQISPIAVGKYVAIFAGVWFLGEAFWRIGIHFLIKVESRGSIRLLNHAFHKLSQRDYDFYTNNFVGSLSKKAFSFSRGFEHFTDTLTFNVVTNIFPIIFATVILWRYSPVIPIILLGCLTIVIAISIPIIRGRAKLVALRHEAGSKIAGRLSDTITNIMAVKSFAKESQEGRVYGEHAIDFIDKFKKAADYQNLRFDMVVSPMYVLTNVLGLVAAIFFTHQLGLQAGVLVIVFSYYSQITRIFWEVSRIYRNIESSISEAAEFTQMFINPPAVLDVDNASKLKTSNSHIKFEGVNFKYGKNKGNLFLDNFDLEIKSNQRVGLVGPSGGGKTTITKLLLRFIDLQSGQITIDGQDISKVTQSSLREAIAYVPQEPLLFHRSLFENISYGNDSATKEDVVNAAKLAHADEFISTLPKGYETLVGERGVKLSGGQRQRVAIARAILKKAPILILDEATSSLDSESEKYIQDGLWELMKDKTALVIAHRLSTIKHLDRIVVLSDGKIVQDGTHEELIKQKGVYATLWSHQSGEFIE